MRFLAQTWLFRFGEGEYLRIRPEPHRPGSLSPALSAGVELLVGGRPATVIWAEGAEAVIEIDGLRWLMSHLTPAEAAYRPTYQPGQGCQEWIVRRGA